MLFGAGSLVSAGQFAVLQNGFRLHGDKIERQDNAVIVWQGTGRIELHASQVASIEDDGEPEPTPVAAPLASAPVVAKAKTPKELIEEAARRHGLPPEFIRSVASVESAFKPNAISPKGAIGVMQLMPQTAKALNADPADPEQNIDAGTRLLLELLKKYENDPNPVRRALAAYNAGSGAVQKYNGIPPYRETQAYVEKVIERYWKEVGGVPKTTPTKVATAQ